MSMNRKPPSGTDDPSRPQRWFEKAQSHQLAPRDETTTSRSGAPVPELAATQALNFQRNGVAFIDLGRAHISELSGRATLRLAALRLGLKVADVEGRSGAMRPGLNSNSVIITFDAGTNTLRMTRR